MKKIMTLEPETYKRHLIHGENRTWAETNCYSDVLIELLHAMGHEPIATLPFTLRIDFEGDQWTFFKFPHEDLFELYGLDLQELAVWRPLTTHIEEQLAAGRPVLVELDSYFLPDTAGTAYKRAHVKSTVAINAIDVEKQTLDYFHNQGFYRIEGQDFIDIFQTNGLVHERMMPPYIEYVKRENERKMNSKEELVQASIKLLKKHLARAPKRNPFIAFKARFSQDLEWLMKGDIESFHAYSFATLRQFGACYELTETYFRWLAQNGQENLENIIAAFKGISDSAKAVQFQLARAMARNKTLELTALDTMASHWGAAMSALIERFPEKSHGSSL